MLNEFDYVKSNLEKDYELLCEENGWNILFQRIKNNASFKMMNNECTVSRSNENRFKNKYREIVPYDYNRILLPKSSYFDSDYINASLIKIYGRCHIVTQYPYKTRDIFWLMVWEFKSPGIIMLGKFEENETESYFPKTDNELLIYSNDNEKVIFSIKLLEVHAFKGFFQRKLRLCDVESIKYHDLWHFEFWAWPDQMAPKSMSSFLNFMGMVRQLNILENSKDSNYPIIHCSAGAGRSGTFCLIDLALLKFEKTENIDDIDISELVENLRVHRIGMVHSIAQLKFSYEAIIEAYKRYQNNKEGRIDKSYLICEEEMKMDDNEMAYCSSSESTASDTVYYQTSDEEDENDFSNNNSNTKYNKLENIDDELNTNNVQFKESEIVERQKIINQRKLKTKRSIEELSNHLEENNLKRYRVISNLTSSSSLSLIGEINNNYYWSIFIVSGTIFFTGACLWLKYNPFK